MTDTPSADDRYDRARAIWGAGDYDGLTRFFGNVPIEFLDRLRVEPPASVLDLGCGTGSSALPLAQRGFRVTALDISPVMIEAARRNARNLGLDIDFEVGAFEAIPHPNETFEIAISLFGVIFSPDPDAAVRETARVLGPGGSLALANWTAASFSNRMNALFASGLPAGPHAGAAALDWGDASDVRSLLGSAFDRIETSVVTTVWKMPLPPEEAADVFLDKAGPPKLMLANMADDRRAAVTAGVRRLWAECNVSPEPSRTAIVNEYLMVRAVRR